MAGTRATMPLLYGSPRPSPCVPLFCKSDLGLLTTHNATAIAAQSSSTKWAATNIHSEALVDVFVLTKGWHSISVITDGIQSYLEAHFNKKGNTSSSFQCVSTSKKRTDSIKHDKVSLGSRLGFSFRKLGLISSVKPICFSPDHDFLFLLMIHKHISCDIE